MSQSTKTREVTFVSRSSNLWVTMETGRYLFDGGRMIGEDPGRRIQFVNGIYRTDKQDEIDFLRGRIMAPDGPGIHELDQQAPDPSDVLAQLATANAEQTRLILEAEREGWERPLVIETCEAKLAQFSTRGPKRPD